MKDFIKEHKKLCILAGVLFAVIFIIYLFAVLKNVIYGSTIFFTSSLNKTTDVLDILALRFLLSFLAFTLFIMIKGIKLNFSFKRIKKEKNINDLRKNRGLLFQFSEYQLFEISVIKDVEKLELLYIACGNVKWFNHYEKNSVAVPQKVKHRIIP